MKILDDVLERLGAWLMGCAISVFPGGAAINKDELEGNKFVGKLDWLIEQGIDTAWPWVLEEENGRIHLIEAGDHLKIYGEDGTVVFDSEIAPDYEVGKIEHPMIRGMKAQFALGCWVCWIQQGWQPDAWAALFIRDDDKRLRAELTKKEGV